MNLQPLGGTHRGQHRHVAIGRAGFARLRFFDIGSNMHPLWDTDVIQWNTRNEEVWLADLAELDMAENQAKWMAGAVEGWATESLLAAREAYLIRGSGKG